MRRNVLISLTLAVSLLCGLGVFGLADADAQRGRRRGRRGRQATRQQAPPQSAAIVDSLGELHWGMEPREVHTHFANQIRENYRERLQKASGGIEDDRIRHQMDEEIRRLRSSYVRFGEDSSGWDSSFLRGEFTHQNQESMLVYRDSNSQNFYFFIRGRLWKWFKAFDSSVFQGQGFDQFAGAIQGRFGDASERNGRLREGGETQHWLEWQDRTTRLRAVDLNQFYGFYCLVFEDRSVLSRLDTLRTHQTEARNSGHNLVDSVALPEETDSSEDDSHSDIVDRITGRRRHNQTAAPEDTAPSGGGSSSSRGTQQPSSPSRGGTLDLSDL